MTGILHTGFEASLRGPPLNPSPYHKPVYSDGPEDWQVYSSVIDDPGTFDISFEGGYLHAAANTEYGAIIIPWREEHIDFTVTLRGDTGDSYDHADIIVRWVDPENFVVLQVQALGEDLGFPDGSLRLCVVEDGAESFPLAYWTIPDTDTINGLEVRVNLTDDRVMVWANGDQLGPATDGGGAVIPDVRTSAHRGASYAGFRFSSFFYPSGFRDVTIRVRGLLAYDGVAEYPDNIVIHQQPPVPRPTLTAGGDAIEITAGTAVAQLVATPARLRLRNRAVSAGTPAAIAPRLQGVLQPVAGSLTGSYGNTDGEGDDARFNLPLSLRILDNTMYVADYGNAAIRTIELDGPKPAAVSTLLSTENMSRHNNVLAAIDDKPRHITIDELSNKLVFTGDSTLTEVADIRGTPTINVMLVDGGKIGSALIYPGGYNVAFKYPLGDFVNGWRIMALVNQDQKTRGSFYEPPFPPPCDRFCDPPKNTYRPLKYYYRDGAYAGDGGMMFIPNYSYESIYGYQQATLLTHNYYYPSWTALGITNLGGGGGARWQPYCKCPPNPLTPDYVEEPTGQAFVRNSEFTGLGERELVLGPDDAANAVPGHHALPTAVSLLYSSDLGLIQKWTIDANQLGDDFVVRYDKSHSRGLTYIPTQSVVYNAATGIYYLTLGNNADSSAEILGWAPNRIVALDLYAPDYVTGESGFPTVSPYAQRVPDPIDVTFTPADTGEVTGTVLVSTTDGGTARIPIRIAPSESPLPGSDYWIDEEGNILIDEDGDYLLFE